MDPKPKDIDALYARLKSEAEKSGYFLNPDVEFTKMLVRGLIINEKRYGYWACPCRLATGKRKEDLDIICPCDYRDPDLAQFGMCFCGLYVSSDVIKGKKKTSSIPDRRLASLSSKTGVNMAGVKSVQPSLPVWRCKVCGYLCARNEPPELCPICKATKDRFERFM